MWLSRDSGLSKQKSEFGLDVVVILFFVVFALSFVFAAMLLKVMVHIIGRLIGEKIQ